MYLFRCGHKQQIIDPWIKGDTELRTMLCVYEECDSLYIIYSTQPENLHNVITPKLLNLDLLGKIVK